MQATLAVSLFLLATAFAAGPRADEAPAPHGTLLLLHYQWKHDTLTLVESQRVAAAVKVRRSSRLPVAPKPSWVDDAPRSPFSYELLGAQGNPIALRYLEDPGVKHVEWQGKGDATLRREEHRVDSADIFLRVPEVEAKTIRFFRNAPAIGPALPAGKVPGAAPKSGVAQGPTAPASRALLAEFPLE